MCLNEFLILSKILLSLVLLWPITDSQPINGLLLAIAQNANTTDYELELF
ncbi:hypothetical protein [Emticicia aquatica]|nr:hypothetical protein [Emticicia aquatica]